MDTKVDFPAGALVLSGFVIGCICGPGILAAVGYPLEEWGDVATWVGSIGTVAAAVGVFLIAFRDRLDRDRRTKEVAQARAAALLPDFTLAMTHFTFIHFALRNGIYQNLTRQQLLGLAGEYISLRIGLIDHNAPIAELPPGMSALVGLAASAQRTQSNFLRRVIDNPTSTDAEIGRELVHAVAQSTQAVASAANHLWGLLHWPAPPPWKPMIDSLNPPAT